MTGSLVEIRAVHQRAGEPPRRWFRGEDMDLFVWQEHGRIVRLQLAHAGRADREQLFEWDAVSGASHAYVDDGTRPGGHPRTPLLARGAPCDAPALAARFAERASTLEPTLRGFVLERLAEWPATAPAAAAHTVPVTHVADAPASLAPLVAILGVLGLATLLLSVLLRLAG